MSHHPASLFGLLVRVQFACKVPQVPAAVKQIDDLNGAMEALIGAETAQPYADRLVQPTLQAKAASDTHSRRPSSKYSP
jgi:hypothetical protein